MQINAASIVAAFFEAAVLPEMWPDALQVAADSFDCRGALLTTNNLSPKRITASHHMAEVLGRFHEQGWNERDLRTERAIASPAAGRGVMRDQDILSGEDIEGSDYYRGFARPAGVGYFACALLAGESADFVALSLQRDQRRGFVSDADKSRLEALLPALQRSVWLARTVRERTIEALFDFRGEAGAVMFLLEADGRVMRGEAAAPVLPRLGLRIVHGRLKGSDAGTELALAKALGSAGRGMASEMVTTGAAGRPLARVSFSPVAGSAHDVLGRGDIVVRVAAIEQGARDSELATRLARLYGLTPAEQRVLLPLICGAETDEIARVSGYTRESVRTWIKSILLKSGHSSRAALVAFARRFESL